jgi:hypothetical protein
MEPKNIPPYLPLVVWGVKRDMNKHTYRFCLKKKSKNVNTIASSESFVRPLKAEGTTKNGMNQRTMMIEQLHMDNRRLR